MYTNSYYSGAEVAGEDLNGLRGVTISGGAIIEADDTTVRPIGVTAHACATGEKPDVLGPGQEVTVDIKSGETIAASNTPLGFDTGGKVTATIADGKYVACVSLAAGSAAGGKVRVRLVEPYTRSAP